MGRSKFVSRARKNWDRLAKDLCFILFGVLSLLRVEVGQDLWFFRVLFDVQLMLAGLVLMVSVFTGSFLLRMIGYATYLIALATIAGLILVSSGSPVAVLVLGFAFQGVTNLRLTTRDREVESELAEVARQLTERKERGD